MNNKVVIVTTTWYDLGKESDRLRAGVALRTVEKAIELGYEIVVVDGGSDGEFVGEMKKSGARVCVQKEKGMGVGRREAMRRALGLRKKAMVWMEPEKEPLVRLLDKVVEPIIEGKADLVVPKRESMNSYPAEQQHSEWLINRYWQLLIEKKLDICFGPRAWGVELTGYFLNYNGEYGDKWEAIFITVMEMLRDGKRVVGVEVDYEHPRELTKIEQGNIEFVEKRIEQLGGLVKAMGRCVKDKD
jgi:glycosyltransferase involved in cell wall biosynthesis